MNRLILIGNGFDLAHGLKTGYNDFLKWYLIKAFKTAERDKIYQDELLKVYKPYMGDRIYFDKKERTIEELIDLFYQRGFNELINNKGFKTEGYQNTWQTTFEVSVKSLLCKNLLDNFSVTNWVDIENEFYALLKQVLAQKGNDREDILEHINLSMRAIIEQLGLYLASLPESAKINDFGKLFLQNIKPDEIVYPNQLLQNELPVSMHILNFNYTSTVQKYLNGPNYTIHPNSISLNHIHGELNSPDNPIIFGFGDELDEGYAKMENESIRGFFEYIKSFWYFKTSNYHDLIRFIDSDEFQVYILGHSCGLSDRTMLNMIFEHEQCKSIKIFYHQKADGSNNYTELTQQIARHFKNKSIMRRKIVPLNKSSAMSQQST